jgi:hypothetical protein
VTQQPSKVLYFFPNAALYMTLNVTHRMLKQHMLAVSTSTFKQLKLKRDPASCEQELIKTVYRR